MLDTLPGTSAGVLFDGFSATYKNVDPSALYALSPGAGASLDGSPTNFIVLGPGQSATVGSDGSNYFTMNQPYRAQLGFLSAPTLYISTTGADSNHGLAPTAPLQTIQGAMDYLYTRFNHGGARLTLQLAAGTYGGFSARGGFEGHYGQPQISSPPTFTLRGDPANPAAYIIDGHFGANSVASGGSGSAVETVLGKSLHVDGVKIQSSDGYGVTARLTGGEIVLHTVVFGACANGHILADGGSNIWQEGNWTVSGDAPFLMKTDRCSSSFVLGGAPSVITFTGARNFSNAVLVAANGGVIDIDNISWVLAGGASVSGQMWKTDTGGIIRPNNKGVLDTLFAGPTPGGGINPLQTSSGGTGLSLPTLNGILYGNAGGPLKVTATAATAVLVTDGGGVPSLDNLAWTPFPSAAVSSQFGTPADASVTARYKRLGRAVIFRAEVTINNHGTASGAIFVTLPFPAAHFPFAGSSYEMAITGNGGTSFITGAGIVVGASQAVATSTYWVDGYIVVIGITYEAAT